MEALGPVMVKEPAPPRLRDREAVDTTRPCITCRHMRLGWFHRVTRLVFLHPLWLIDAECCHPVVVGRWHENGAHGWAWMAEGVILAADPVSGEPERRRVPCHRARALQQRHQPAKAGPPAFVPCAEAERAPSNCGPDGRYWEPRW